MELSETDKDGKPKVIRFDKDSATLADLGYTSGMVLRYKVSSDRLFKVSFSIFIPAILINHRLSNIFTCMNSGLGPPNRVS